MRELKTDGSGIILPLTSPKLEILGCVRVMDVDAVITNIVNRLTSYETVRTVILFGSRARGDEQPRSDIDLAVEAPDVTDGAWNRLWADVEDVDTLLSIDLIHFDRASTELRKRILSEGKVLYDRHEDQTESG